ncbi:MAG: LysR substrate-binding domain-containing protein, partial [Pseudomonadota bacterium]
NEFAGTSLDAIRQMAGMGTGLAVLPSLYALTEARRDPDLVLRPIDDPMAEREVSLVWRPTSPLRETFETLADVMRSAAKEILE